MADSQRKTANLFDKDAPAGTIYVTDSITRYGIEIPLTAGTYTVYGGTNEIFAKTKINDIYGTAYGTATARTYTLTENGYILIYAGGSSQYENNQNIMLSAGSEPLPFEPYGWVHSLRKLTTATEAVENPLYSDGTAITNYTIKGNTVQSGTPTPSNPVTVNGVGERTANLFNINGTWIVSSGDSYIVNGDSITMTVKWYMRQVIDIKPNTDYTISFERSGNLLYAAIYGGTTISAQTAIRTYIDTSSSFNTGEYTQITILFYTGGQGTSTTGTFSNIMLVEGSTVPSEYIPYGYKIPISTLQGSAYIYLNEPLYKVGDTADTINADGTITRRIGKVVLDGTENQWILYEVPAAPPAYHYALYQLYTNNALSLGGVQYSSCYSEIAPYGLNAQTRQTGDLGVYLVTSGNEVAFQMEAAKSSFPDVEAWTTYLSQNPVTVYYIKATPTTEQITLPTIPTTDGANSISVDTTVQPSEFTATWTGWHDAEVKEKSENLFDVDEIGNIYPNPETQTIRTGIVIEGLTPSSTYYFQITNPNAIDIFYARFNGNERLDTSSLNLTSSGTIEMTSTANAIRFWVSTDASWSTISNIMLVEGSTAPSQYEPYWK